MALVGIVGFISSGKGTVGDILEKDYDFIKDSFAAPLKDAASIIFGWDRRMLEGDTKESREWREIPDQFWSEKFGYEFSPRKALQLLGTESCRDVFHYDIWVISLLHRHQEHLKHGVNVVVTDVRFKNEIQLIREAGGKIVWIHRGDLPIWYDCAKCANAGDLDAVDTMNNIFRIHLSEWEWIGSPIDYTINNDGTLDDLHKGVQNFLDWYQSKNDTVL